jgi:hypothetical protein
MPKEYQKKREVTLRSSFGPKKAPGTDTVPDLDLPARLGVSTDTVPEQAGIYVPPRPLASASDHRTIEIAPVRLAQDIDPRRAPTELRLSTPVRRSRTRPGLLVLGALLALALAVLLAVRLLVPRAHSLVEAPASSPAPEVVAAPSPPPQVVPPLAPSPQVPAPHPSAPASGGAIIVGPPISEALTPLESSTPPATSARPKLLPPAPQLRDPAPAPKKKPREPWLE